MPQLRLMSLIDHRSAACLWIILASGWPLPAWSKDAASTSGASPQAERADDQVGVLIRELFEDQRAKFQ